MICFWISCILRNTESTEKKKPTILVYKYLRLFNKWDTQSLREGFSKCVGCDPLVDHKPMPDRLWLAPPTLPLFGSKSEPFQRCREASEDSPRLYWAVGWQPTVRAFRWPAEASKGYFQFSEGEWYHLHSTPLWNALLPCLESPQCWQSVDSPLPGLQSHSGLSGASVEMVWPQHRQKWLTAGAGSAL